MFWRAQYHPFGLFAGLLLCSPETDDGSCRIHQPISHACSWRLPSPLRPRVFSWDSGRRHNARSEWRAVALFPTEHRGEPSHIETFSPPIVHLIVCVILQILQAVAHGQVQDRWGDMPYSVGDVAGTGRPQDLDHVNHGRGNYRPLSPNVSGSHHQSLLLTNMTSAAGPCGLRRIPWYRTSRYPCSRPTRYPRKH